MSDELKEPAQLREAYDKLKESNAKLEKTMAELQAENRTLKVEGLFTSPEVGLTATQAKLYPADRELSLDAVKAFATEFELKPAVSSGKAAESTEETTQDGQGQEGAPASGTNLSLISRSGSGTGSGGQPPAAKDRMSTTEFFELREKDPEAAEKARREGRVELAKGNFYRKNG